jgi:hypothetical protein
MKKDRIEGLTHLGSGKSVYIFEYSPRSFRVFRE